METVLNEEHKCIYVFIFLICAVPELEGGYVFIKYYLQL